MFIKILLLVVNVAAEFAQICCCYRIGHLSPPQHRRNCQQCSQTARCIHTGLHGLALSRYQLQTVSADLQANRTIFQSASDQQYCIRYGKAVFTADELN